MNVTWGDNYIDATNTFIGGGGDGSGSTGGIVINNNSSNNNLGDYINTSNESSNVHLYIKNPNTYGDIRFANLYTLANTARNHNVKIDYFGKLYVYHPYSLTNPTVLEGWKDVESEIAGLIFGNQVNLVEMAAVQGQIAGINFSITDILGEITSIQAYTRVTTANLEALQYGFFNINEYNEFVTNTALNLIPYYSSRIQTFANVAFNTRVNQFIYGAGIPLAAGAVIGFFANHIDTHNLHFAYSNALSSNPNVTQQERNEILAPTSNMIRNNYISFNSNFSNMTLEQGFINSNIITTQFVPSLKSNKVLLGNITTPNSSYQMEMTGDLNANEYYRNSVSLTSLLAQKQDNMSATQPIYITTSTIGLNYDSSLTKVGNNLKVVKTATAPLKWTGNDISLDYDSTLLNNSGSLGVSIAAESKWGFTGANIYNKAKTNVGIGTDSGLIYKLNVVGDSYFSSIVNIATSKLNFISSYTTATLTQVTGGTEYYLQYTGNGTLVLNEPCACDLLIVGAGGDGGTGASSGGGGAGEVIYYQNFPLRSGTLNITVGTSSSTTANRISKINHSSGDQIKALGGGNGGLPDNLFTANGSITITINAIALYNYTESVNLSPGTYTITFATGAITLTGIAADKSYPLLKNGSGVTINPTAWYKFDSGALLIDSSGNGYNLTNNNTAILNTTDFIKGDASLSLNGTNQYLSTTSGFNLNNKSFSISVWLKPKDTNFNVCFNIGTSLSQNQMLHVGLYNGGIKYGFFADDYDPAYSWSINNWYHIVWTFNTTSKLKSIYANGSLVGSTTAAGQLNTNNTIYIGYHNTDYFNGLIDDLRIYEIEMSLSQVTELYKGRVLIYANPTSGGSGGGGAKSQIGAVAGVKFDDYKSLALAGLNGTSTTGGNGGTGNTTYGTRYTTTITGTSLSVALGGSGVTATPATPATKTNYGDGGDGNGGTGYQGIVIIRFKEASSHLQLKATKDNANTGLILNANESPNSYQLRLYPWSDTYQLTGISTRGWSMRVHDGNNNLDLLNLFSSFGGRIGIKTKNPSATLDVNGDIACKTFSVVGNELYGITCQVVNQHNTGEANITISAGASGNYGAMSVVYLPSENLGYISCSKSLQIKTQSAGSYIHIDNTTGNVGIGNNVPTYKLVVAGTIGANDIMVSGSINVTTLGVGQVYATGIDNGYFNNLQGSIVNNKYLYSSNIYVNNFIDCQNKPIYNCSILYGTADIAKEWTPVTNYWHKDDQGRQRFYFKNDTSGGVTDHYTMIKSGSYTIYFRDKDDTDYLSADRFGLDTYFPVTTLTTDYLSVIEPNASGTWQYRRMMIKYGSFTEFHRVFVDDDLYIDYDDFMSKYVGRVIVSTGKTKHAKKEPGDIPWEILEDKDAITIDDAQPVVQLSRQRKDKRVYGVITYRQVSDYGGRICVNALGEGGIWVINTNGNLENGDYLQTSNEIGYAERQDDDIMRNYTIAKVVIDCTFELDSPKYKCEVIDEARDLRRAFVGCVYYCG